jgi:pSer/pThr/pTyr-binding forkhead associated (FHA) protein
MKKVCRIGRNESNDLVIQDRAANDFHAIIEVNPEGLVFIRDLTTHYGTFVNGQKIQHCQLFPGDEVQIGFSRIDWVSHSGIPDPINELEIRPSFSVPVKQVTQQVSDNIQEQSEERIEKAYSGHASKALAGVMLERESYSDRLEKELFSPQTGIELKETKSSIELNLPENKLESEEIKEEINNESTYAVNPELESIPEQEKVVPQLNLVQSEAIISPEENKSETKKLDSVAQQKKTHVNSTKASRKPISQTGQIFLVLFSTLGLLVIGWLLGQLS